jgi:hypothetical protein
MSCDTTSSAKSLLSTIFQSVGLGYSSDVNHVQHDKSIVKEHPDVLKNHGSCLELFFKTTRGMSVDYLEFLLEESWKVSPRDTLRTMFYIRDCRGGKGEKKIFFQFMVWLWKNHREFFEKNVPCIPFYGCFKDLRKIIDVSQDKSLEQILITYWCKVLGKDVEALNRNEDITLAAKWVPIQDGRFSREMSLTHKLFRKMIRMLREKLDIVECKMSSREWDKIYFERVSSLSMKKYNQAFKRNCKDRVSEYLSMRKTNVDNPRYPCDIVKPYMNVFDFVEPNETMEMAWDKLLTKCRSTMSNKKIICVVDTSGSMNGKPLEVAVSLGLLMSELYPESRFYRKFITFSSNPCLEEVQGETLCDRVKNLRKCEWGMTHHLQKTFHLLLEHSTSEDYPDVVLILSDMDFDKACGIHVNYLKWNEDNTQLLDQSSSNLEEIERKYKERGLPRPKLIFWNLRNDNGSETFDFPSTSVHNCQVIDGYSNRLMEQLLTQGDICPLSLFRRTIDNPRYDLVYSS